MPLVLAVADESLHEKLAETALGRADVEWLEAPDPEAGFETAATRQPRLVIVALGEEAAEALVRRLRDDERTRTASVVVVLPFALPPIEHALRLAGANAVLSGRPDPFHWDHTLEALLHVPSRSAVRIPVLFWTWFRLGDEPARQGRVLNLSEHGLLLESPQPMDLGTRIEARLTLAEAGPDLSVIGEVVREAGGEERRWLYGVVFRRLNDELRASLQRFVRTAAR